MNLKKATKILATMIEEAEYDVLGDRRKALESGIEALKMLQTIRNTASYQAGYLLLDETKE